MFIVMHKKSAPMADHLSTAEVKEREEREEEEEEEDLGGGT